MIAIEDPSIREVALGDNGLDTASRSKVVWQVLVTDWAPEGGDLADLTSEQVIASWAAWHAEGVRAGVRARARRPQDADTDPCITSPEAAFRSSPLRSPVPTWIKKWSR